jgi:membrane fusion protein (multidrug efflux system)
MTRRIIVTAAGLLILIGALVGTKVAQFQTMSAQAADAKPPPPTVAAAEAREEAWQPSFTAVGTVVAVHGVVLHADAPGSVKRIRFDSGAAVRTGDVIVELDTSSEQAQLQSALANAELARSSLTRVRALRGGNAIAPSELDSADARAKQASAEVVRLRAEIAKRTIRAPFAGNLGIWQINLGQFLQSGAEVISVLALDPVYVDFTLPQQRLSQLRTDLPVRVTSDAFPNATFEGKLSAIDPGLDSVTRSVQLRATLANPKGQLRPGMFAHVEIILPDASRVLVIPATAVIYAPYGDSVFVLEHAKEREPVARQHFVRLGERRGDYVVVTQGLRAGDSVVTAGAFKLRNGAAVAIDNSLAPQNSLAPTPSDN